MRLIWLGGAWLAGIALGLGRDLTPWWALAGWVALGLVGLLLLLPGQWRAIALVAMVLASGLLGAWRASLVRTPPADLPPGSITGIRGRVADWPRRGDRGDTAVVAVDEVRIGGAWRGATALVRADLPVAPRAGSGDRVQLAGIFRETAAVTPEGFRVALARQGLHGQFRAYDAQILGTGERGDPAAWTTGGRTALEEALRRHVPGAEGALVTGILLGDDALLPLRTRRAFDATGTSHLTALSGWNVALIAGLCAMIGKSLRRGRSRLWLVASAVAIWAFVLFAGAGPTLLRAAIMATLYLLADALGRRGDAPAALAAATVLLTALAPATILDIGFQLSCAATVGLLLGAGQIAAWLGRWHLPRHLATAAGATLAAEVATLPLMAHHFGRVSTVTLPANLLIEPAVPAIMASGVATTLVAFLPGPLADLCGLIAWLPARLVLLVVETLGALPWATRSIAAPGWPLVGALYLALGLAATAPSWLATLRAALPALRTAPHPGLTMARGTVPAVALGLAGGAIIAAWALLLLG